MKSTHKFFLFALMIVTSFSLNAQLVPGITIYDNATLGPNILENGSFEDYAVGPAPYCGFGCGPGWCHFGGCQSVFITDANDVICNFGGFTAVPAPVPVDGAKALKMFGDFGNGGFSVTGTFSNPNIPIKPGVAYQTSCYMYSPTEAYCPGDHIGTTDNFAEIHLEFKDAAGNLIEYINADVFTGANANGEWQEFTAAGIAPSNAAFATVIVLFLQPSNQGGAVFFDGVQLNEVRFPNAPTLGEWGILNLGLILLIIGIVAIRQVSISRAKVA